MLTASDNETAYRNLVSEGSSPISAPSMEARGAMAAHLSAAAMFAVAEALEKIAAAGLFAAAPAHGLFAAATAHPDQETP